MTSSLTTTLTRTESRNTATESHKKQQHINMNMNSAGCSSVTDVTEYIANIEYSAIATTTTTNKMQGIDNVNVKRNATSLLSSHSPAHKSPSRIPCPLNCNKQYHRSASVRLRDIKRIDALSVKYPENLVNERSTTTTDDQRVSCETGVTTAGNKIITRPKLVLKARPPSNTNILLKRSLSLRRNYKVPVYSNNSDSLRAINNKNNNKNPCLVFNGRKSKAMSLSPASSIHYQVDDDINCKELVDELESVETMVRGHSSQSSLQHNEATEKTSSTATITYTRPVELATSIISTNAVNITSTVEATVSKDITDEYVKPSKIPANTQKIRRQQQQQQQIPSKIKYSNTYKATPKTPPVTPISPTTYLEDDLDSLYSYGTTTSGRSTMSCEHPYVARNGTTFSGRKMKYVVHCSNYAGQVGADYLTPTQRAQRQVRRLKELLYAARHDLEQKDADILRLTREVVELRLFKASLSSPDERSTSSDAITVREADLKTSQDVSPIVDMVDDAQKLCASYQNNEASHAHLLHGAISLRQQQQQQQQQHLQQSSQIMQLSTDMQSSFADSGHFEDMTSSSVHSKDSSPYTTHNHDQACSSENAVNSATAATVSLEQYELQRQELIRLYEQRIEELVRNQDTVTSDIKRTNNDRIEALLQKLAECNTRYADIVPDYEHAKERIRELEKQLEDLQYKLAEQEEKQKQMYLHMYQKGQEAERIARADKALELAHRAPQNKVSITELLHQLQSTQDELENIRAAECRKECGSNHALLTAKEAISLWVLGARKTIYRRLLEAQKNRTHVDPEVTLQFLKSAVYYFLTDKENSQGHLDAIESILEFSETERQNISKARARK